MYIRKVKEDKYEHVLSVLRSQAGSDALLSAFEVDMAVNGVAYRLTVQPARHRMLVVLKAVEFTRDTEGVEEFEFLTENVIVSALLEIWLYQILQPVM